MKVNFILIGEGSSDLRLVEHIESLLIDNGFEEASGEAPDLGMLAPQAGISVREKVTTILKHYPHIDVIFVHRDADNAGMHAREVEIHDACNGIIDLNKIVPVIPVSMLETWLLADQDAIKRVAGNIGYLGDIKGIPKLRNLERTADSKSLLLDALCEASGATGGRLTKFKKRFSEMRARLTFDLDPNGPVTHLPSYQEFCKRLQVFSQSFLI